MYFQAPVLLKRGFYKSSKNHELKIFVLEWNPGSTPPASRAGDGIS